MDAVLQLFGRQFWTNFVLAMTMQWFLTIWIGLIRPQNWKLPLKWVGWALIPAFIGAPWSLLIPPISAWFYLLRHRRHLVLIFVNATIVIFLVVVLINDVTRQVAIELWSRKIADGAPAIAARLLFQIFIYSLISLAVSGMHIQPGNLTKLALSRKEQWTVMAMLASLTVLAETSSRIIHHLQISHAMLTFSLSIELVMVLLISASLFGFLQSFFSRQRMRAKYQETLLRTRYDRRISDQVQAIRQFKQIYQKQMLQLGDYLDAKDYEGLAAYYETLNNRWQATSHLAGLEADGLQQLGDPALKSLLFQKILAAQNQGRDLHLEIPDAIVSLPMASMDLLRIVGILLDNAIEAPIVGDRAELYCAILVYPESYEIAVANPVSPTTPPQINRFLKAGYTTKGNGHGQGLSTVRELIDQTENAALQVAVKRGMLYFTVILTKPGR
ncbi:GHKL domain-containing protein [Levilactobacillus humaensis]|uniref:GHKL domain-containing protein n=1 Tax=Levilactobacillus humaensis TaxID=2950375 RepID=UPI0021C2604A|nr:GHKL domain-containing protein [Levilactobacillus humaensis]